MKNKNEEIEITELNISSYTIEDGEFVKAHTKLNKAGYPLIWPTKNLHGQKIVLTFMDARITDFKGNKMSDHVANFSIYDDENFDENDKDAELKIEFISALLSNKRVVTGGVYFKGKFYTRKMTTKQSDFLTKSFMQSYFHIEDRELLLKWFDKMGHTGLLPYWPTKSADVNKPEAIFSAINATVTLKGQEVTATSPKFNFHIFWGDTFDLNNSEDVAKVDIIKSLLDENRVVRGFYYKGKLLPNKLNVKFKLYLEKTFIKKNFTVNQRDYLFTYISKDRKTGYSIFWPMKDNTGRKIVASVVNAAAEWFDKKYSNFDVYEDEFFDLSKEEFQIKFQIMQSMYSGKDLVSGALYFDGMLIPGIESKSEIERRKGKVEKALKIYIDDTDDFMTMTRDFSVNDREKILRLVSAFDKYYPDGITLIKKRDREYKKENGYLVKFDNVNPVTEKGDYLFDSPFSLTVPVNGKIEDKNAIEVIKYMNNKTAKVHGAVYYKGVNIASGKYSAGYKEFIESLPSLLTSEDLVEVKKFEETKFYRFKEDRKTHMPLYWPTKDENGRSVILSSVRAAVHFKNGRRVVKAANNMNFNIFVGETFGLVGESGSGKTTISRAILGINKLAEGGIYFKGKLISSGLSKKEAKATKKNIQMIFQDPAASLNERANVDYIISEGLYNFKMFKTKEERLEKVSNMLKQVGLLPEHLSRYPHEFSGGQRQRIGIARALVIEPELVLADEPISALDVSIRAQILNLLKKMQNEQDLTYLFIAHDLSIIRYISDRIAVMHKGYLVELGPAEEIYSNPLHPYTRSLLTAIPQPDPKTKDLRKRVPYNQGNIVYEKCYWREMQPGHFVLVNDDLEKSIKESLK